MRTLHVNAGKGYDILIERGILSRAGRELRRVTAARKAGIITDSNVAPLYLETVSASLREAGFQVAAHVFDAGEASKTLNSVGGMLEFLAAANFTRGDVVVALGGGVSGDMAGFAASAYQRGIPFLQIPTTLLSQIDSSVGGKTGVDLPQGKNLCGAFWQPNLVLIDPDVLSTLPARYFADGMAEAVKYGCIKSLPLFERLEKEKPEAFLEELIYDCVDIKRGVVERDEREKGERMLLNFGHTLGHALEKLEQFTGHSHGEAVSIGMALLTRFSEKNGVTPAGTTKRITALLEKQGLPTCCEKPLGALLRETLHDKKSTGGGVNFVMLETLGKAVVHPLTRAEMPSFFGLEGQV